MVPVPSVAWQRCQDLAARNSSSSSLFVRAHNPPTITYGKKDAIPLSLTAKQFRPDVYAIPSDDEEDDEQAEADVSPQSARTQVEPADSEDSELSDAEPLFVPVNRQNAEMSRPPYGPRRFGAAAHAPRSSAVVSSAGTKKGTARFLQTPTTKPVYPPGAPKQTKATTAPKGLAKGKIATSNSRPKSKAKPVTPARRLPVNELFLVASPTEYEPASSRPDIRTLDPINDQSSSPRKRSFSPISKEDGRTPTKAPLSAIRKRLKTPKFKAKSLAGPRSNCIARSTLEAAAESRGCDGFDSSELVIAPHSKSKRQRKLKEPLIVGFSALQLQTGPLPDVRFESSAAELKMEESHGSRAASPNDIEEENTDRAPARVSTQGSRRRVSFSDRVRQDIIMAQLSSISAPERRPTESDESDVDEDEELYDEDEDDDGGEGIEEEAKSVPNEIEDVMPCRNNLPERTPRVDEQPASTQKNEDRGVTLDFRRTMALGQTPKPFLGRRALMEVNEAIVEVPDSEHRSEQYVFGVRNSAPQLLPDDVQRSHRPRSILKHSTQIVPDSTTRPEQTEANTRRNSMVDVEESRYFTYAADTLHAPDPARHVIAPRRRSSYFDNSDVQVIGSERVVPETSSEPPDYTNNSNLNVLRKDANAIWTSSSDLPTAPRDLKTLTRSISREAGTLSQSARRRPSLPFQSPTKLR